MRVDARADSRRGRQLPRRPSRSVPSLGRRLASGEFVTSVRVHAPARLGHRRARPTTAAPSTASGANLIAVHEDRGAARLDVLATAAIIARSCPGTEPLVHYTCRDRKLPRMMSDLLGAAATGLHNVLLLTGDPPGSRPVSRTTGPSSISTRSGSPMWLPDSTPASIRRAAEIGGPAGVCGRAWR